MLDGYGRILVCDYRGWEKFGTQLAGVQQCCALISSGTRKGIKALYPARQRWAEDTRVLVGLQKRYGHPVKLGR